MAPESLAVPSVPEAAGSPTDLQAAGAALRDVELPTGVWGYERHAVDAYLGRVRAFVDEALALRHPEGAVRDALARVGEETSAVLQRATEVAEDITARSQTQADDRIARAERDAAAIRQAAEAQVHELDAEIEHLWRERARLIADVEHIADELSAMADAATQRYVPGGGETGDEDGLLDEDGLSDEDDLGTGEPAGEEPLDDGFDAELPGEGQGPLGEEDHGEDVAVRPGEVPAAAELQITRVLPRIRRD